MYPALEEELHEQFFDAVRFLDLEVDDTTSVLRARPGTSTVKVGTLAVKLFARSQSDYWRRELEAYRALEGSGLAPPLAGGGELWVATTWLNLVTPGSRTASNPAMHHALGTALARLHAVDALALPRLSMERRLQDWLRQPAECCPRSLARAITEVVVPLVPVYRESHFVHGDWGHANVLVSSGDPFKVESIIDFEGSHLGDPAEDFKWQLATRGAPWREFDGMVAAYIDSGGVLGPDASERLVLAATEWCLDLLTWSTELGVSGFQQGALAALDAFVSGEWPSVPRGATD